MPHTLRALELADETAAQLTVLTGFDQDLAAEATRTSNRLRGLLTQFTLLSEELNVILVNARHAKNLPGRKTDVSDAAWLAGTPNDITTRRSVTRRSRSATSRAPLSSSTAVGNDLRREFSQSH